jgi:hypothetical protein
VFLFLSTSGPLPYYLYAELIGEGLILMKYL